MGYFQDLECENMAIAQRPLMNAENHLSALIAFDSMRFNEVLSI
jgi:hypothetical protein